MRADVPVGVFLSGGLDSSIVSALMRVNTQQTVHSFTIKFSGEDQKFEQMAPDWDYARQVAKQFGFTYHEIEIQPQVEELLPKMVWHLDEPLSDPAAINTYLISKAARDLNIVVLLNGMGGDEIFGGYRKHLACLTAESYQAIVPGIVRRMVTASCRPDSCGYHQAWIEAGSLGKTVSVVCFGSTQRPLSDVGPFFGSQAVFRDFRQPDVVLRLALL